jgi:hypothetical protein
MKDRQAAAEAIANARTRERLKEVVKPNSISGTLRKTGIALILAPDPITAIPGAVMLGASIATRGKRPLSPTAVYEETQKLVAELDSLF